VFYKTAPKIVKLPSNGLQALGEFVAPLIPVANQFAIVLL